MDFFIDMIWDDDVKRWTAVGSNEMGLILESDSFDVLVERVKIAAPEMIELNFNYRGAINLYFITKRIDRLEAVG